MPHDYRDLLEILLLRAQGHKHQRTWLVWLWLRGRDYPLKRVREAIATELLANLKTLRAELSPTGRFCTESFLTKYRRNIAPTRADSPFPDLGGLEEPIAALMMRPSEAAQIPINLNALVSLAANTFRIEEQPTLEALQSLIATPPTSIGDAARLLANLLPPGPFHALIKTVGNIDFPAFPPLAQFSGIMGDGYRRSTLLTALNDASDHQIHRIRMQIRSIRTGQVEQTFRNAATCAAPEDALMLSFAADWTRSYRLLLRGNPALAAYLYCLHLKADGLPTLELLSSWEQNNGSPTRC